MGGLVKRIGGIFSPAAAGDTVTNITQASSARRPVRAPTESDPEILAAQDRARRGAKRRKGRQSTILTDALATGSSGQSLGA